ncbi:hypothetical protein TNCV_3492581 [Trichonephila clavipes]|nr:hypothetical protein TNCV_3492581 [Trichonephila clavipes]
MDSLGHSSLPPTALDRQDDEEATSGARSLPYSHKITEDTIKRYLRHYPKTAHTITLGAETVKRCRMDAEHMDSPPNLQTDISIPMLHSKPGIF